jgi:methane monooxygenase PmoA-like
MPRRFLHAIGGSVLALALSGVIRADGNNVTVTAHEADRRVDITVAGQPFTSYIWPTTIKKPVLYPLRTAKGLIVTRGFPLDPRPGERVDHPHHVGLWFNYGNVDGYDFWNNSDAIPEDRRPHMGTIYQRAIGRTASGAEGILEVDADWVIPDGTVLLKEHTTFVFGGTATTRTIDRTTTLTAQGKAVSLADNKEGVFGMRVARALEIPSKTPEVFTDASGKATAVPTLDNTGVNGDYLTSEGKTGDAAWGTRGKWCVLAGKIGADPVSIAIFDAPKNPGFPTYWHARGYGLFAANPLGQKDLSNGKDVLNYSIAVGQSATFRYRVLIVDGAPTAAETEAAWKQWSK